MLNIYFICTENPNWLLQMTEAMVVLVQNHVCEWSNYFWLNTFGIVLMSWKVQVSEFTSESFNYICKINSISPKSCHLQKNCRLLTHPDSTIGKHHLAWLFLWGREILIFSAWVHICSSNPGNQEWKNLYKNLLAECNYSLRLFLCRIHKLILKVG